MESMESSEVNKAEEAVINIVKEGWLMKRGEVIKNWRPRSVHHHHHHHGCDRHCECVLFQIFHTEE